MENFKYCPISTKISSSLADTGTACNVGLFSLNENMVEGSDSALEIWGLIQ